MAADWLILHAGALGDLALTLHLSLRLPGVREAGRLTVISRANPGDLSTCQPAVLWRSAEGLGLHWLFAEEGTPPTELQALVAGRSVLSTLGGVRDRVHRRLKMLDPERLVSIDPRPRAGLSAHITVQWEEDLATQGLRELWSVEQCDRGSALMVPDSLRAIGRERLQALNVEPPPFLIHPGSGGTEKCWPLNDFLKVGRRLRLADADVLFVVGPVEQECWTQADVQRIANGFPLVVAPQPGELTALLCVARAVISSDCGPAHLARLLGTPTLTLFGPSEAAVWRPLGDRARIVRGLPGEGRPGWNIEADAVARAALEFP